MNLSSIFRRENVTIGVEAGKEVGEVMADGKVTIRECIDSAKDVATCALEAYGKKDEVLYEPSGKVNEYRELISDAVKSIEAQLTVAAENGITYGEAVELVAHASRRVAGVICDIDQPLGGGSA